MALKVETNVKSLPHNICDFCAFLDDDDDFYLIDSNGDYIVQLEWNGCITFPIPNDIETIEQFLRHQFGTNTLLKQAYRTGDDYSITVQAN